MMGAEPMDLNRTTTVRANERQRVRERVCEEGKARCLVGITGDAQVGRLCGFVKSTRTL